MKNDINNMHFKVLLLSAFCLLTHAAEEQWSRQINKNEKQLESSTSVDWVPVKPSTDSTKDRAGAGRALSYHGSFAPNVAANEHFKRQALAPQQNHHGQQQQQFGFPYQFQRFGFSTLPQQSAGPQKASLQAQPPTSQSFFKFEMPTYNHDGTRQEGTPNIQTGYQIHHTFGAGPVQQASFNSPLYSQKPTFPPEFHPIQLQQSQGPIHQQPLLHHRKPIQQNFVEAPKQPIRETKPAPTQEPHSFAGPLLQQPFSPALHYQQIGKPASFQSQLPFAAPVRQQPEEEVQLVYVPYDTLYNQQQQQQQHQQDQQQQHHHQQEQQQQHHHQQQQQQHEQQHQQQQPLVYDNNKYNLVQHQVNPYQINDFYTEEPLNSNRNPNLYTTTTTHRPSTSTTTLRSSTYNDFLNFRYTTEKPKPKPKAHQPPLAMFLERNSNRVSRQDVVHALSSANSIAVIDSPTQTAPHVFIGPAGMPAPSGYKKFELPYLSSLDSNNLGDGIKEIPFFVAPLSYRAPQGFNKILLPEPHVGSIVINKQQDNYETTRGTTRRPQRPIKNMYITPVREEVNRYQSTTQRVVPTTTHRLKVSSAKDFYPELIKEITSPRLEPVRDQYEYTTLRQPSPTPSSYNWPTASEENNLTPSTEYYQQEAIHEVTSPKIHKLERGKTHYQKRPEAAFTQTVRPYSQFKPMPNNIVNEEYYKVQPIKTSPTTTTTTTTSTSATSPQTYFTEPYTTSPRVEIQSNRGQVYHEQKPEVVHRFTTRPTTISDEEQRMKTYFRQQEAHRNRPYISSTTPGPIFESVQYTPVSVDYDREVQIPSTTPSYYGSSTARTTTPKQRYTFYHPNPTTNSYEEEVNTVPPKEDVVYFSRQPESQSEEPTQTTTSTDRPQSTYAVRIPNNHRTVYANEIKTNDEKSSELDFDNYPYQHPSELPPLTPNLPGLVNALIEKERLNALEKATTEIDVGTTTSTTRPTRRPIQRVRKPMVSKVSSSVSYSSSDTTSRRTLPRRRPYTPRNYTVPSTTPATASGSGASSTTRASFIRNPNRIRYNPTPEERQSFRIKQRKPSSEKRKNGNNNSEDLEYQRDVLKQNYPVFKPTTQPTTLKPEETQEIYTVTPNSVQSFPELIEPMQIAQQFQEYSKDNYGPGYFPNEEDMSPTEPITKNEVSPIYTTTTTTTKTTTTEEVPETTKRPSFVRRGNRPVYPRPTTTEAVPASTTSPNEEKYTVRPRNPPPRKVIKIRARTRRPHPASTSTAEPEQNNKENTYQKLNRFNQDFYKEDEEQKKAPKRIRTKSKFHLDTQETKWSPSASANSNFQPLDEKKNEKNSMKFENEPQIVTAAPDGNEQTMKKDSYLLNVSAAYGPSDEIRPQPTAEPRISKKTEKSFTELLEEVMSDIEKGKGDKENENSAGTEKIPDQDFFESQRMEVTRVQPSRRGVWRKVRVHPKESFETAESQNIGTSYINSIFAASNQERSTDFPIASNLEVISSTEPDDLTFTTPKPSLEQMTTNVPFELLATEPIEMNYNSETFRQGVDILPPSLESSQDSVTISNRPNDEQNSHDSITRRIDDIDMDMDMDLDMDMEHSANDQETQPSLFAEVKQQLSDLFAAEAEDDIEDGIKSNISPRKQEYTSIQRVKTMTTESPLENVEFETEEQSSSDDDKTTIAPISKQNFHKKLMDSVVYATSTSTKVTHETEICYRGRCIKSAKQP